MQVTIQEIHERWGVSRSKIYKDFKDGKLSRLSNGKVDAAEAARVYEQVISPKKHIKKDIDYTKNDMDIAERQLLLEQIKNLQNQLQSAENDKEWLKQQVEQSQQVIRLLEDKRQPAKVKKGLFARVLGAISDE
jgi:DNA-binding transcriptional regulator GbsR (MarR family)